MEIEIGEAESLGLIASRMSSELLYNLFECQFSEQEICFITYIQYFVEKTYEILNQKYIKIDDFMKYIENKGRSKQQELANKIYKMLKNRDKWTRRRENFIKLESLLFQYEISREIWKKKSEKARKLNDCKYAENRKLKEYILNLYNSKIKFKNFYTKHEVEIKKFIKENCSKLNDNNFDLYGYVERIIRTRNQIDNKNIIRVRWD